MSGGQLFLGQNVRRTIYRGGQNFLRHRPMRSHAMGNASSKVANVIKYNTCTFSELPYGFTNSQAIMCVYIVIM